VPNAQAATTTGHPTESPLNTAGTPVTAESDNSALELAIVRQLNDLPEVKRQAFHEASKNLTDKNILDHVKACDANHLAKYHHPRAEALSRFLGLLDRFMGGITIAIQANPDISAIVVGGVRLVIDVAVNFIRFFTRLSDMLCRLGDFLRPFAEYVKASAREELVLEALASVYGNLLQFCRQAHEVFAEQGLGRK
jgi:ankyrin repeat domain-containing protein 50